MQRRQSKTMTQEQYLSFNHFGVFKQFFEKVKQNFRRLHYETDSARNTPGSARNIVKKERQYHGLRESPVECLVFIPPNSTCQTLWVPANFKSKSTNRIKDTVSHVQGPASALQTLSSRQKTKFLNRPLFKFVRFEANKNNSVLFFFSSPHPLSNHFYFPCPIV